MRVPRAEVGDDHSHRAAADSAGHLAVKSGGSKVGEFVGASVEERAQLRGLSGGVAELRGGGPARSLPAGTAPVGAPAVREDVRAVRFQFSASIDERQIRELCSLRFIHEASNVIFLGPPGVGKTHLSVALAAAAIQSGFAAYFITAHDLATDLGKAYREGRLDRRMRIYLAPKVLVIDEVGYLPLDDLGTTIFFQLISGRYERGSILLTSNKSYGDWGSIFGDSIIATAILDRLLHHSTTINIRGESYRLKDRRRAGLVPPRGQEGAAAPTSLR